MNQNQLYKDIGYIKGKVEAIEDKLDRVNGDLADTKKKVTKHDIVFGKLGVVVTAVLFVVATLINLLIDWIKSEFFN